MPLVSKLSVSETSPLHWLYARGIIAQRQLGAARRLENRREQHPDKFQNDLAALGPGLSEIVWQVVIAERGLREAETALGWPARSGTLVLKIALDRLASHYRMPA